MMYLLHVKELTGAPASSCKSRATKGCIFAWYVPSGKVGTIGGPQLRDRSADEAAIR